MAAKKTRKTTTRKKAALPVRARKPAPPPKKNSKKFVAGRFSRSLKKRAAKPAPSRNTARKKHARKPPKSNLRGRPDRAGLLSVPGARGGPDTAGQSGDTQGLSGFAETDSESVKELLEEGQAYEAEVVEGVESVPDADRGEVRMHEVPEDDVPEEYRGQDAQK